MPKSWNGHDELHGNLKNLRRLLVQPYFWAGMLFLGYILVQYINPSAVQAFDAKVWWLNPLTPPLGDNFPSSIKSSYSPMNALRAFVIHASAISLVCGIIVGIQRRKSALIILWAFILSGAAMGFIAILQKLSGTDKLLWLFEVSNPSFWGTFAYRNQAAGFLILIIALAGLLYFFYERKARRADNTTGPHLFLILIIILTQGSIWLSLSRGGIILSLSIFVVFWILVFKNIRWSLHRYNLGRLLLLTLVLVTVAGIFVTNLSDWNEIQKRWHHFQRITLNIGSYDRVLSTKATFEMAEDRLAFGWGAGSFRYVFPIYQKNYNSLWYYAEHPVGGWYGRRVYSYAHNDWAQFLAEYGIIGSILILSIFSCLVLKLYITSNYCRRSFLFLLVVFLAIIIHNIVDFIFSSPAYWVAFWGSLFLFSKLVKNKGFS